MEVLPLIVVGDEAFARFFHEGDERCVCRHLASKAGCRAWRGPIA